MGTGTKYAQLRSISHTSVRGAFFSCLSWSRFYHVFTPGGWCDVLVGCKCMGMTTTIPHIGITSYGFGTSRVRGRVVVTSKGNIRVVTFPRLYVAKCAYNSLFTRRLLLRRTRVKLVRVLGGAHRVSVVSVLNVPITLGNILLGTTIIVRGKEILNIIPGACLPGCGRFCRGH